MKADERQLMAALQLNAIQEVPARASALEMAREIGMHYKRARYVLRDKWERKGWFDYGVTWARGWLTDEGRRVALA